MRIPRFAWGASDSMGPLPNCSSAALPTRPVSDIESRTPTFPAVRIWPVDVRSGRSSCTDASGTVTADVRVRRPRNEIVSSGSQNSARTWRETRAPSWPSNTQGSGCSLFGSAKPRSLRCSRKLWRRSRSRDRSGSNRWLDSLHRTATRVSLVLACSSATASARRSRSTRCNVLYRRDRCGDWPNQAG